MRKNIFKTFTALAVSTFLLAGCAGSESMNDAAATDDNTLDVAAVASVPVAVIPIASLSLENPVPVGEMFEDIDNTEQYDALTLIKKSPNLSTFATLVDLADMESDLERIDGFTLFAPTNEAFAKVPKEKLEMLLNPENKASLMRVIQAHVLPSKVPSMQFNTSQQIALSEDRHIPVDVSMGGTMVTIGGATIVKGDIEASDGIIHVVDGVIVPSEDAVKDEFGIY
ncbi:fasciclin domain-containing protein [Pontibacter sp. 172403-2]|uniref:fasciclin domain-containing protein n=1 Tax=Pontibacter rufus TaxID=2791028 RepID=UPI0018AFFC18|nr:fasciclin domain-containing protein [Pontibacter sp. 172403-2]MBF9252103.1 fasciclin domain-containing protein [Pontibacter sp. 172403-2]